MIAATSPQLVVARHRRITELLHRLRPTSRHEVEVRTRQAAATIAERLRFAAGHLQWDRSRLSEEIIPGSHELAKSRNALARKDWPEAATALRAHFVQRPCRFVLHPNERTSVATQIGGRFPRAPEDAMQHAAPLLEGRYTLLGFENLSFGSREIDWHFDPVHRRRAPMRFWASLPYLDPQFGDHKLIWELNRHQHWLALGRAAWLTEDRRYRERFSQELSSWLDANPPLTGINWTSMLELAFRSISWLWALHFFAAFDDDATWLVDLLMALQLQLNQVARHLSYYFSPNTHLLGEGLALYVAGRSLPELKSAARWEAVGRDILLRQSTAQITRDGGHAELSAHYHRYALDFYLLALAVARRSGDRVSHVLAPVAERLARYCRSLADDAGWLPALGDDDGGMLFPICGRAPADASDSLALSAALLGTPDLAVGDPPEEVLWMLGGDSSSLAPSNGGRAISTIFPDSGYAIMRSPNTRGILDVGPHGFLNGGHAHADALSFVLTLDGEPLLVDPGTATYTMDASLRDRFRSTPMHNAVVIDSRPHSEPLGPFHWRTHANARAVVWKPHPSCDYVEGEHEGYLPLVHRRAVLRSRHDLWIVIDHVLGRGVRRADFFWHFDPAWMRAAAGEHWIRVEQGHDDASVASTAGLNKEYYGDRDGLGWSAPVYGRIVPALTVQCSREADAPFSVVTAITAGSQIALAEQPVEVASDDTWHRAAATIRQTDRTALVMAATAAGTFESAGEAGRAIQRVVLPEGQFATDARVALLRWRAGKLCSVDLIDVRLARWQGSGAFELVTSAAQDLHLDGHALEQLNSTPERKWAG